MRKLFIIFCVVMSFMCFSANGVFAEKTTFSGERTIICTFDRSDLNNFVDGGYNSFEEALNEIDKSRYNCNIEKLKRDVKITISFSFESKDEYESYLKELLGYRPVVIYQTGENFIFAENFEAGEMLNIVQKNLLSKNRLKELKFDSLLNVENCTMTLNGKNYETKQNFDVRNNNQFKYDDIDIISVAKNDGTFERTIKANINKDNLTSAIRKAVIGNFKAAGDFKDNNKDGDNLSVEVVINAENQYDLDMKTLLASGITVSTIESETNDKDFVNVECIEKLGIKKLLNENGTYSYEYTYPNYYKNLQIVTTENLSLNDNKIVYSGDYGKFEYSFQRGLKLSSLHIKTNYDNFFKRIERTIILGVPMETAEVFDEKIQNALNTAKDENKKAKININTDGENKLYSIVLSSRNVEDICNFTETVLRGNCQIERNNSLLPLKKNSIMESIRVGNIVENMVPISEVEHTYILPSNSKVIMTNNENYTFYENEYSIVSSANSMINLEYSTFNIVVIGIMFSILIILILLIVLIIHKIKKQISNRTK